MAAQTRARTPVVDTPTAEASQPERQPRGQRGNAFRQDQLNAPPADGDGQNAAAANPRATAIAAYKARLTAVSAEIAAIPLANEKQRAARAVIAQAVQVQAQIDAGETVNVESLPRIPAGDGGATPAKALPPEWVAPARSILALAGGTGATPPAFGDTRATWGQDGRSTFSTPAYDALLQEGKKPADYGVPAYQTQSNNLASPEATCNVTSMAMVLERLGYSRDDLILAVEDKLKRKQEEARLRKEGVAAADIPKKLAELDMRCVMLRSDAWKTRVLQYLRAENGERRSSNYQKPRGAQQTEKQLDTWAGQFKDNANMDDLVHFILDILGLERTAINADGNPRKVLDFVNSPTGRAAPTSERIDAGGANTWARTKTRVKEALDQGGSAMISVRHKGRGQSGTHIVAIQAVESGGIRVDDPYGTLRPDYDANKAGDGFSTNRGGVRDRDRKNQVEANANDWQRNAPVHANETKGESNLWSDETVQSAWGYVTVFRRAQAPAAAAGAQPAANTTGDATTGPTPASPTTGAAAAP